MYNKENIFAKILKKDIPAKIIFVNDIVLAFHDISPKAKIHVLVIPKVEYINFSDFISKSNNIESFFQEVKNIAENILHLKDYKILTNNGVAAGQEVFHFHVHILGY
jgi:diadenosine tetraphosphate (Ap4A) HIT family hydrolase